MIWFLREGSIPPLISSEATSFSSQAPCAEVLTLQYYQEEKRVALSVKTGDAILNTHGEDVLTMKTCHSHIVHPLTTTAP